MKSLGEIYQLSVQYLQQKGIERSKFLIQQLLSHILDLSKLDLFMQFDRPLTEVELEKVRASLALLGRGKPIEQIIGHVDFFGCKIHVTSDVLIPRPETELLLDIVEREVTNCPNIVWDICTGSGCIGISYKKSHPNSHVSLSDISFAALDVARQNAIGAGVSVEVLQGDLLLPFKGKRADLIFCNPPYISSDECSSLDESVRLYEPLLALDGGADGLDFYRRLSMELPLYLNPSAKIYFEIGYNQAAAMFSLFSSPIWAKKRVIKDLAGHDRFFFLEIE